MTIKKLESLTYHYSSSHNDTMTTHTTVAELINKFIDNLQKGQEGSVSLLG